PPTCSARHASPRALHSFPTRRSSDLHDLFLRGCARLVHWMPRLAQRLFGLGRHVVLVVLGQHLRGDEDPIGTERALRHHALALLDRKSTRLNSSHVKISYAVFCLKKK